LAGSSPHAIPTLKIDAKAAMAMRLVLRETFIMLSPSLGKLFSREA
jgi:hypothetical protein